MPTNRRTMPTTREALTYSGSNKNYYYGSAETTSDTSSAATTQNAANSRGGVATAAANSMFDDALPVDPWARARDYSGTTSWRQSGNHGYLDYTGEATTWTEAQGQEMIAPEVNRHNMITMTQHLRDLGYKIPDSYDSNIQNMPQNYRRRLERAYSDLRGKRDPLSTSFKGMMSVFEKGTGLDLNNLMFNSMDILSTD
jgi:hypothetical protein